MNGIFCKQQIKNVFTKASTYFAPILFFKARTLSEIFVMKSNVNNDDLKTFELLLGQIILSEVSCSGITSFEPRVNPIRHFYTKTDNYNQLSLSFIV